MKQSSRWPLFDQTPAFPLLPRTATMNGYLSRPFQNEGCILLISTLFFNAMFRSEALAKTQERS
jgi:hypothetical protein